MLTNTPEKNKFKPEVGQGDMISRKLHCFEARNGANNVVDVNLEKICGNQFLRRNSGEKMVDVNLKSYQNI